MMMKHGRSIGIMESNGLYIARFIKNMVFNGCDLSMANKNMAVIGSIQDKNDSAPRKLNLCKERKNRCLQGISQR